MNLLGIDFEEWFHPELIQKNIKINDKKLSVVNGIDKILNLLSKRNTFATFFVVGELIEKKPELLDKIIDNGHEIAFHTMYHTRLDAENYKNQFNSELEIFKKLTNNKSKGFRAPSFSLNENTSWAIDSLKKNGYVYDSSIAPVKTRLYGVPKAEKNPYKIDSRDIKKNQNSSDFLEFPLLTTTIFGKTIMAAGGFYIRTLPLYFIKKEISSRNKLNFPATMYVHSWELTPEFMPKFKLPFIDNFITYHNIENTFNKIDTLLNEFEFTSFEKYI